LVGEERVAEHRDATVDGLVRGVEPVVSDEHVGGRQRFPLVDERDCLDVRASQRRDAVRAEVGAAEPDQHARAGHSGDGVGEHGESFEHRFRPVSPYVAPERGVDSRLPSDRLRAAPVASGFDLLE
jgi:hypothetical protein